MLNTIIPLEVALRSSDPIFLDVDNKLHLTVSDWIGQSVAVLGSPNSGKSNTTARLLEQLRPYMPQHLLDIHNEYYGLAEKFDYLIVGKNSPPPEPGEKKPKSPPVHIEAGPDDAAKIAEFAYRNRLSVIVQMLYMDHEDRLKFTSAYCRRLWELNLTPNKPMVVLLEEAHNFIPQQTGKTAVLSHVGKFANEGRKFGFTIILVTQRPAKINKDILGDCNFMFLHKVNTYNDISVYKEMVLYEPRETKQMVLKMRQGDAITKTVSSGDTHFDLVKMLRRETYHGGATPTLDFDEEEPPPLRAIDAELVQKMQALLVESAEPEEAAPTGQVDAELVAQLNQQIADLQTELAAANAEIERLMAQPVAAQQNIQRDIQPVIAHAMADRGTANRVPAPAPALVQPKLIDEWDGRSELAIHRARKKQQREFDSLLIVIGDLPLRDRRVLTYLTQREEKAIAENDMVRYLGYTLKGFQNTRPVILERLHLVERKGAQGRYTYKSSARKHFEAAFPDLEIEALVGKIKKLEPVK